MTMISRSGVFVLQDDNSLVSMQPAQFASEGDFQRLLSRFPALLVGDQVDPENPRRWALVKREQAVATDQIGASQWSIDHLFLDQDGIPTLVEIKRQSDTRIRREVVGQMLDYAANCITYWSIDALQASFEKTCEAAGQASETIMTELIGPEQTSDEFWNRVKTNLLAGKIRLLFVADVIPIELRRVVEFLNKQMDPAEVLAIELRQYEGEGLRTLVPMVFGQTEEAAKKKVSGTGQRWDEERIFEKLQQTVGPEEMQVARSIFDWMRKDGRNLVYGSGQANGSVWADLRAEGVRINLAYLCTDGRLYLPIASLERKPIFGPLDKRRELLSRFGSVEGVNFTDADLARWPSIPLNKIAAEQEGLSKILSALRWIDDQIAKPRELAGLARGATAEGYRDRDDRV